ncbi:hypothetical protein KDW49_22450 [Burkholderia dolosa]|uniref:hypothetical protein n=1 Tax=Burkholderia dolosa TaxID=152500 RepID=UPI001BA16944|nr:hypothetical protein [Burkholderia dolosa]MBR8303473.1 hypothetical protein [Burkholderia dolosa]
MANSHNVIWLRDYAKHPAAAPSIDSPRSSLHASIADDGTVDFEIDSLASEFPGDRPALLMASLIMCMRLTKLIDEEPAHV